MFFFRRNQIQHWALALLCSTALAWPAMGTPLFPRDQKDHWAQDALATLSAKGLVSGYPDGTFKGDRSVTRWELAMIVARLLSTEEASHAAFASKQDLAEIQKIAEALQVELQALGVRVGPLEEQVQQVDARVTELERLTFYGSLDTRMVSQSFYNTGNFDNDNLRGGTGAKGVAYLDYNSLVGSSKATTMRPQANGVIPVVDYRNGRALLNGAGFTARAILGLKLKVSDDIDAGAELVAYSAQGNQYVDAYLGLTAPWLLNPSTANQGSGFVGEGANHSPSTSMVLDHLWVKHKPSGVNLRLGAIDTLSMDKFVYQGQGNLGVYGPKVFPGFGVRVDGTGQIFGTWKLQWEAFAVKLGSGNQFQGLNYQQLAMGADLYYNYGSGDGRFNFMRYADDTDGTNPFYVGLLSNGTNVPYNTATTYYPLQWVNPAGYLAGQRSSYEQSQTSTLPNTVDTRPIAGFNGAADNAIGLAGGGNYGPQASTIFGSSGRHTFQLGDDCKLNVKREFATSNWKPNRNSSYSRSGQLLRGELDFEFQPSNLDISLGYLSVDPTYSPVVEPGNALGLRFIRPWNFTGRFTLHDTNNYPHNREGIQFKGHWNYDDADGGIAWKANFLQQKQTSLYDVRLTASSIGPSLPTQPVIGFSPGFFDTTFQGFATPYLYGSTSASSFDDQLRPLENPRGKVTDFGISGFQNFNDAKHRLRVEWNYEHTALYRPSSLEAGMGGSQNFVDLKTDYLMLGLNWKVAEPTNLRLTGEMIKARGHHDPLGLYNGYAVSNSQINFANIDSTQWVPGIGVDHQLAKDTRLSLDLRYFLTTDNSNIPAGANPGAIGSTANPFSWQGLQVMSEVHTSF